MVEVKRCKYGFIKNGFNNHSKMPPSQLKWGQFSKMLPTSLATVQFVNFGSRA